MSNLLEGPLKQSSRIKGLETARFRSRCLKINPAIAASPMTKMQGLPAPAVRMPSRRPWAPLGGCASSRLDHGIDLQPSRTKFGGKKGFQRTKGQIQTPRRQIQTPKRHSKHPSENSKHPSDKSRHQTPKNLNIYIYINPHFP